MPQTLSPATTAHPVLVEVTETRLVWIEADTPEQARDGVSTAEGCAWTSGAPLVDYCAESRIVTEQTADWLDLDPDQVERLDAYFAHHA